MKPEDAEEYTQALGQIVAGSWRQVALAQRLGVPKALGLTTEEWVNQRLGGYVKMSVAERREPVKNLTEEGYSTREISEILGVSHVTIASDVKNLTPIDAVAAIAADEQTHAGAKKAKAREKKKATKQQQKDDLKAGKVVVPRGQYHCLVIDPPWPMDRIEREVRPNQVDFDYPVMSEQELLEWPLVHERAHANCHLWLWTTQRFLPLAFALLDAWRFNYLATFVWHKTGGFQPIGLPQYNCEFIIMARRGTLPFLDTRHFFTCFEAGRRQHSRKPDAFYDLVQRVSPGPRLDMFSREKRDGFDQHGLETELFNEAAQ